MEGGNPHGVSLLINAMGYMFIVEVSQLACMHAMYPGTFISFSYLVFVHCIQAYIHVYCVCTKCCVYALTKLLVTDILSIAFTVLCVFKKK